MVVVFRPVCPQGGQIHAATQECNQAGEEERKAARERRAEGEGWRSAPADVGCPPVSAQQGQ